jgi:selenocysteine-specific elongation factor
LRHLIVGTAGHIDHGKSALVKALTGTDPDRLKEEQARGITIELGFADLDLGGGRVLSFVDVPGHERFVRHMVAGATGIDAVMLVIAADEGVKPQTREHRDICELLGPGHGLVVLSKADLADEDLVQVLTLEVREFLAGSFLAQAPVVPVSTITGQGLPRLREGLARLFDEVPRRPAGGVARLPVDRSFVLKGFGTVVTGSLVSGTLHEGDEIEVLPSGGRGRVRGLQVHRRAVNRAVAGQRTAANLQGLTCADVPRGSTVTEPGSLRVTRRAWAKLRLLPGAPQTLNRGGPARFHQGTCERRARFRVLDRAPDGGLYVEMFLDRDAVLVPGDRFILRRSSPVNTVGGGTVVDIDPPHSRARGGELRILDGESLGHSIGLRLARAGPRGRLLGELAAELGTRADDLDREVRELERTARVIRAGARLFVSEVVAELERRILLELEAFHARDPLRPGISREELRVRLSEHLPQDAWRLMLERMQARGQLRLEAELVARAGHQVVLTGNDLALAQRIEKRLLDAGLDPPEVSQVLEGAGETGPRLLGHLLASGRLVKLPGGRLFHVCALEAMLEKLRAYATGSKMIDVATFKELAGVTRKNAIPLLEYLDDQRVTRRVGNVREILHGTGPE